MKAEIKSSLNNVFKIFARKKCISKTASTETKLKKCLSTFDLVSLGIGCTLGCGIYVVTGEVIRNITGPAVVISFVIAAVASVLAAFSYAEFGARVPRAGSAYIYSYVTVGEIWAFIIGWNLILEYVIGAASTAKATSSYFDSLFNHQISSYLSQHTPLHILSLSPFPDFVAFGITMIVAGIVCFGIQESSMLNNIFMLINVSILIFVIICGTFWVDIKNWYIPQKSVPNPEINGKGGFFPFGFLGVVKGASVCFYSYIGFDVITIAGEETMNPKKSVPISIMSSLFICSTAYVLLSSILTLMVPYYYLAADAPLSSAFVHVGWNVAAYVIDVGAIICLISCLITYVLAMPRIFYAMACDGLLFHFLSKVNQRFKTPINATLISGLFTAILAMFFELIDLVNMMSIGTLLAYTLVSISVLLLRYQPEEAQAEVNEMNKISSDQNTQEATSLIEDQEVPCSFRMVMLALFRSRQVKPSKSSYNIVRAGFFLIAVMTVLSTLVTLIWSDLLFSGVWWTLVLFLVPNLCSLIIIIILCLQPKQNPELSFLVPLVPVLPISSAMINIYLMLNLPSATWWRFLIWMILGFVIYFGYGIDNSNECESLKRNDYKDIEGSTLAVSSNSLPDENDPVDK